LAALLLELRDTLLHSDRVIADVPEGLAALSALRVQSDTQLPIALVSDEPLPASSGLIEFFQPASQRVTLSSELGAHVPDPVVFRTALSRLDLPATLSTAMFVTGSAEHAVAARRLGMTAWQLSLGLADWSQLPLLVAWAIGEIDPGRLRAAYALRVRALFRERLGEVQRVDRAAHETFATLAGEPPAEIVLELDPSGDIVALHHVLRTAREQKFDESLETTDRLAAPGDDLSAGQTHKVEPGPAGTRPRRKRFSIT
jgi:hypothetical protein